MSLVAWCAAGTLGILGAPLVVHAYAYARAAAAKRQARDACPFEDDDHDTLPALRAVQLVVAESLLWVYTMGTAIVPPPEVSPGPAATVPILVLPPPWLPRAAIRTLVGRLRRDGMTVVCPRLPLSTHRAPRRQEAIDQALRAIWERYGARVVDVIAPAGSATDVARHLAAGGSGVPTVRRLLTLGAAGGDGPPIPAPTEVIALYSHDDPLLGSVERARRPAALNVAVRALGRLGLLHAPHAYTLLREHLHAGGGPSAGFPWTNATS
jgi:hypothetical protein